MRGDATWSTGWLLAAILASGTTACGARSELGADLPSGVSPDDPCGGRPCEVLPLVSVTGNTSCAAVAGRVRCWGDNQGGQLGDGTIINSLVPVDVVDLSAGLVALSGGDNHTCALDTDGGVACWGGNITGELGNGSTSNGSSNSPSTPGDVIGLSAGVRVVSAGGSHTCVVTSTGAVECWGENGEGMFTGGASTGPITEPVGIVGLSSGAVSVAIGVNHACAVTSAGGVLCWGHNDFGQLGDGTTTSSFVPVGVVGLSAGVTSVALGGHRTCAVTSTGAVQCWGRQPLGDGTAFDSLVPVTVVDLPSSAVAVTMGILHSCALTSTGSVVCWGDNTFGQLGNGSMDFSIHAPVAVTGLSSDVVAIATSYYHTCAVTSAGAVKCWGKNDHGELGDGTTMERRVPVAVVGF
ncbi:MAG: hypothetical protein QM820_17135 [Minicystis sp.]